jgi:predicted amidohydrolase
MVFNGAKLVFVPFREERPYISYIRNLVSARAIENVIPLVGCGGGGYSRRFDQSFRSYACFVLPSGKIVKEESKRELSVHTFPPLDTMIKRERSRMNWERPFDRNIKFSIEQDN